MDDLPRLTTQAFIGIVVAISGNVLISLALNLQKLAHKRLDQRKQALLNGARRIKSPAPPDHTSSSGPSLIEQDEDVDTATENTNLITPRTPPPETRPLLHAQTPPPVDYSRLSEEVQTPAPYRRAPIFRRLFRSKTPRGKKRRVVLMPVDVMAEEAALHGLESPSPKTDEDEDDQADETAYLKSKLWWLGFFLMNVGELGNFISYAFAPASVVAPLGTFALIANCVFAPVMLGERFRKRDFFGICVAIVGAVTVVLSSHASDTRLNPQQLLEAITQIPFVVYASSYAAGAIILAMLSQGKPGRTYVFIDVGLCALFGGFTVLSTKALSTLISLKWYGIFADWITYPLIIVLMGTGIGQIRYLNRALMRFDSKAVIPIQFVFFTLSAIIGSAILYGDFRKAGFHEIVTFLYGCAATFTGVFILAHGSFNEHEEHQDDAVEHGARLGMGTIGKRQRATLVLPSSTETPQEPASLRGKRNSVALVGISPAQHLLLVHTPTREVPSWPREWETGHEDGEREAETPGLHGRNRMLNGFGNDAAWSGSPRSRSSTLRESSAAGRLRSPQKSSSIGNIGGS